jgi:hypothetical protein
MAIDQTTSAVFDGTQDSVTVTWTDPGVAFSLLYGLTILDAQGAVGIWATARSATGCTINTSARFTGTVDLLIKPH